MSAKKIHIIDRDTWDWSLSNCALGRLYGMSPQAVRKTRIKLGNATFIKHKRPKIYSESLHCGPLTLKQVDESEGLSKCGPKAGSWRKRFLEKVEKGGPDECWEWTGTKPNGYGMLCVGTLHKTRKEHLAHRLSFVLHNGDIPRGQLVRHTCDNRGCQNPRHLELGTNLDNVMDAVIRQWMNCGEKNGMSKTNRERRRSL